MKKENKINTNEILYNATMYKFLNKDVVEKDMEINKSNTKLSKNTLAYCITAIICVLILAFAYLQVHRYSVDGIRISDKYKKTWTLLDKEK